MGAGNDKVVAAIDLPIAYQWPYRWDAKTITGKPVVNRLTKAILEKDTAEMDKLFAQGASFKACDQKTIQCALYHVLGDYQVIRRLVEHGLSRIGHDIDESENNGINDEECLTPDGYRWGLLARAYWFKAYDVMDLLAANGFTKFNYYEKGWEHAGHADKDILRSGDPKGLQVLLENSYAELRPTMAGPLYRSCYEKYIMARPQIRRKSIGLDPCKFYGGPSLPQYEKVPLIFGRREAQARNARMQEDYNDRLRAYREFVQQFGEKELNAYRAKKRRHDEGFEKIFVDMARDL